MRRQHKSVEQSGPKVPAYIVTFSDMVTLLLTFFVMLLSLANVQDPELFNKGRESFLQSVRGLGLGLLFGRRQTPKFGNVKVKYSISSPDRLFEGRSIDAKEEEIRRAFDNVSRSMRTMPSQIVAKKTNFSVTNIRFGPGDATLNELGKKFLTEFCLHLQGIQQDADSRAVKLYVLGLAGEEATEKQQWMLSARRAKTVADFLQDTLLSVTGSRTRYSTFGSPSQWHIYSWGAGPGGNWIGPNSPVSRDSHILIAVLRPGD